MKVKDTSPRKTAIFIKIPKPLLQSDESSSHGVSSPHSPFLSCLWSSAQQYFHAFIQSRKEGATSGDLHAPLKDPSTVARRPATSNIMITGKANHGYTSPWAYPDTGPCPHIIVAMTLVNRFKMWGPFFVYSTSPFGCLSCLFRCKFIAVNPFIGWHQFGMISYLMIEAQCQSLVSHEQVTSLKAAVLCSGRVLWFFTQSTDMYRTTYSWGKVLL